MTVALIRYESGMFHSGKTKFTLIFHLGLPCKEN